MVDIAKPNDALKVRMACPNCGKVSQLRNLSYKHVCKPLKTQEQMEARCSLKLKALQQKAMSRLQPPGPREPPVSVEVAMDVASQEGRNV